MPLSKGFRPNSTPGPLDFRLVEQGLIMRSSAGQVRPGILYTQHAGGNVMFTDSAMRMYLFDRTVLALARTLAGSDGVDILTNVGTSYVPVSAPTANSWYITIWARQNDGGTGGQGDPDSLPTLGTTIGDASATPAIPATPANATKIGHLLVPATATTTQSAGVVWTETIQHTTLVGSSLRYRSASAAADMAADIPNLSDGTTAYSVSGDLLFLKGGKWRPITEDTGWVDVPLTAPMQGGVQVRRKNGIAFFRGQVGNPGTNFVNGYTNLLTIPDGFRPSAYMRIPVGMFNGYSGNFISNTNGIATLGATVITNSVQSGDAVYLTGVSYPVD